MMMHKGDLVRVREDLKAGLGVVKEQLEYAGKELMVDFEIGYGICLKGNDFVWKNSDLILLKRGEMNV